MSAKQQAKSIVPITDPNQLSIFLDQIFSERRICITTPNFISKNHPPVIVV
jgi:hypothetical protein